MNAESPCAPLPWRVVVDDCRDVVLVDVRDAHDDLVAKFNNYTENVDHVNASLIVTAVNAHEALVAACKLALPFVEAIYREHGREYLPNSGDALEIIQGAIVKAEP